MDEIDMDILNLNSEPGKRLPKQEQDKTATLHAMKIINDDSKYHL